MSRIQPIRPKSQQLSELLVTEWGKWYPRHTTVTFSLRNFALMDL